MTYFNTQYKAWFRLSVACLFALLFSTKVSADNFLKPSSHPNLTITRDDVSLVMAEVGGVPQAKDALLHLIESTDAVMKRAVDVPTPRDAGGGYTHEQHKRNYQVLYEAGLVYQLTQDSKYANFAKTILLKYAAMYPTLDIHPKRKEQSPGRLFWQSLNEAVWLVYTIQAYDMLYDGIPKSDRKIIEENLLRPVADFLSEGQPQTFDKIHNHGTWAAAAVGMTGYVLDDKEYVNKALYGLDKTGKAGFLKQIEQLFSPDGYYTEGPYYQRYALMPFVLFGKAINSNDPDLGIFEYNEGALKKAIYTTIQLSYNGLFFGINDAIKDKGIDTIELVHGVAIAYEITKDPTLLSIAEMQDQTLLTGYGFKVAQAINKGLSKPFKFKSMNLSDGQAGNQGSLTIFRNGWLQGHQALVMKNTSQGMGHGHFDKLSWLYFDNGNEIVSDYGAARFLNIEAKYGGHYLPENNAWAKQTVAHNTVVIDENSHFNGDWKLSQKYAPSVHFFNATEQDQIVSASIDTAYQGVEMSRTMAMINHEKFDYSLVVDVFTVLSDVAHKIDLPLHYQGQLISHNLSLQSNTQQMNTLGTDNGYQFLWDRARGKAQDKLAQITWLKGDRFYSYSTIVADDQEVIFAQLGANDPDFNLRPQQAIIHRLENTKEHTFVSVLETHGEYNGRAEYTKNATSKVKSISAQSIDGKNVVSIEVKDGGTIDLAFSLSGDDKSRHKIELDGKAFEWVGHYKLFKN